MLENCDRNSSWGRIIYNQIVKDPLNLTYFDLYGCFYGKYGDFFRDEVFLLFNRLEFIPILKADFVNPEIWKAKSAPVRYTPFN